MRKFAEKSKTVGIDENPLMLHMWRIRAPLLRPKSAVLGSKSHGFEAKIGGQIAARAKNRVAAKAYAQRTPCRMMLQK
jgi:hypothetical protein